MSQDEGILEVIELTGGIDCDVDEAWPKITARQFPGDPGRASGEVIQNALDSYASDVPWEDRLIRIETRTAPEPGFAITDYGQGMSRERVRLLVMLGGTDKAGDSSKIGKFGIGFFSLFNPKLRTRGVRVSTRCEGRGVEIVFRVHNPDKVPEISIRLLETAPDFSTRIDVEFAEQASVTRCVDHAVAYLRYYPCNVTIDGRRCRTVWQDAKEAGARFFKEGGCDGFLWLGGWGESVDLLCKYEYIKRMTLLHFINGGYGCDDLRDYRQKAVPYVPGVSVVVNCNNLSTTISRDSFMLDWAWEHAVRSMGKTLVLELGRFLNDNADPQFVIANHYALQDLLKPHVEVGEGPVPTGTDVDAVLRRLADAKVYRLSGRRPLFSLRDIAAMRSPDTPVFFSPGHTNLRWLGGEFRHDFAVLPPRCSVMGGAPRFYDSLFTTLLGDVVNLDTVGSDQAKIADLVRRGIVDQAALMPKCDIVGAGALEPDEARLLTELDELLARPRVRETIARELHRPIGSLRTVLFSVDAKGAATVATGLFDADGRPLGDDAERQRSAPADSASSAAVEPGSRLLLGLARHHPFIRHLVATDDPWRCYFAIMFLSAELARCQRQLLPHAPLYHYVKERLASAMRRALLLDLAGPSAKQDTGKMDDASATSAP